MIKIPDFLEEKLTNEYSNEELKKIINGYTKKRPVTLRINSLKTDIDFIKKYLDENKIKYRTVKWFDKALILEGINEQEIEKLDIYQNGLIYLQSLSSMLPPLFMVLNDDEQILDMAAAPGGKTTQISALSNNQVMITAVEKNKVRVERLKYNIEKQGAKKINVMNIDACKLDDYFSFDSILLDAPCSGSGTINLEDIDSSFNEELVNRLVNVQKRLLRKAVKLLKPGKEMIYSTCSILKEENEEIIKDVLSSGEVEIVPIENEHFKDFPLLPVDIPGTLCLYPNELFEGFFIAKLKKVI